MDYNIAPFKQKYEGYEIQTDLSKIEGNMALMVYVVHPISKNVKYIAVSAESIANRKGYISAQKIHSMANQIIKSFKPEQELENILIPIEGELTNTPEVLE